MSLDYFILMTVMIFIIVPEKILSALGFDPEKMSIFPFLFIWIFIIVTLFLLVKAILWVIRSNLKFIDFKSQHGFIAIIAVGILALLMLFAIIVQQTVMDTYTNVKNMNNYYTASNIGNSAVEFLQFHLRNIEAGYNTGEVRCRFSSGVLNADDAAATNGSLCSGLADIVGTREVEVVMKIKGRASDGSGGTVAEKLSSTECGSEDLNVNGNCYVIPFPATGDAGSRCDMYDPVFEGEAGGSRFVESFVAGRNDLDQVNFSCNWNKLSFGSSLTDRVAIPLYYDLGDGGGGGAGGGVVNPFCGDASCGGAGGSGDATQFILRLRTPCLPCGVPDSGGDVPEGTRECESGSDPTVCEDAYRYVLETEDDGNEIVVQWHLSGECNGEECGLVARALEADNAANSAIYESNINTPAYTPYIILRNDIEGIMTEVHPETRDYIIDRLVIFNRPILTLFLNNALISDLGKNVPYLEYQVLTDYPAGNPKSRIEVTVNVDGNVFRKTLSKEEQKPLIDFAVQN